MVDDASFIDQFHGLTGKLLSERKKNLFILLEKYRSIGNDENILEKISSNLKPKTYLEETYKVEFLLYFKRVEGLFEIVKDGNVKLANKIIKQKWFLIEMLKDITPFTPQKFVNTILPQLSLVMRMKILKQILKYFKDEKFMDDLFQELLSTYGLRTALVIISGCSLGKIKEILTERGLKISMAQIKLLHDKDKSLIRFYYEEYHKRGGNMASLNSFTCYLSKKDPSLFMELRIKYDFSSNYRLGRRNTRCYIEDNKESITEDPLKYLDLKVFKESVFVRKLGSEFSRVLDAIVSEIYVNDLGYSQIFDLLKNYPRKERYTVYNNLYREHFGHLFYVKEEMTLELLETISSQEEREKWVEVFDNKVEYIQFKRSTLAIPELKELLFRADNATSRIKLFEYIINTCSISKDYDSLLDILKLIRKRYRNNDAVVSVVLRKLKEKMDLCKLTEEHWKYINEIITMRELRELKNLSVYGEVIMEYSKFLYRSGKSFEELIPRLIKSGLDDIPTWKFVDAEFRDEKFENLFLKAILKCYPNMDKKFKTSYSTISLVTVIKRWNQNHPHDLIIVSHEKPIIEIIQELARQWIYCDGHEMNSLKYLICGENNAEDFEDIYFDNINILSNVTITKWFLKNKPEVFAKHIDKIQPCFSRNGKHLTTILKKLEYLGLVKAIVNHYTESLVSNESTPETIQKELIAQLLASVMPTADYLQLLAKYIPKIGKLDLTEASEEDKTLLQIETSFAQSVRFSSCHTAALPIILKYCKGDCLQPALHSLYSCFNHIPEKDLKHCLPKLMNERSVSLRKHAMFLAVLVFPISVIGDVGEEMIKEEKVVYIKKHLFSSCYKYFLKNPSHQLLEILQKYMESLSVYDQETLQLITDIHNIPAKYKDIFAEMIWQVLDKFESKGANVDKHYESFFQNIRDCDIRFLTKSFCSKVINTKFWGQELKGNPSCWQFAIQLMMYGEDTKEAVHYVMQILHIIKERHWNGRYGNQLKSTIYHFCLAIFDKTMNKKDLRLAPPIEFVSIIREEWKAIFAQHETLEEYLMLEFMDLKYQNNTDLEEVAQKIWELLEDLRKLYGDWIVGIFQDFLKNHIKKLIGYEKYESKLKKILYYLSKQKNIRSAHCILIINLLPAPYRGDLNSSRIFTGVWYYREPAVIQTLISYFKKSLL